MEPDAGSGFAAQLFVHITRVKGLPKLERLVKPNDGPFGELWVVAEDLEWQACIEGFVTPFGEVFEGQVRLGTG